MTGMALGQRVIEQREPPFAKSLVARNAIFSLCSQVAPLLAAAACMPGVAHGLSADEFGLLGVAWAVYGYFNLFDLGISRATTKFLAEAIARRDFRYAEALLGSSLCLQTFLGVGGALLLWPLIPLALSHILRVSGTLRSEASLILMILLASLPITLIGNYLRASLEGVQSFGWMSIIRAVIGASSFLVPWVIIKLGFGLVAIVLALSSLRLLSVAGYWVVLRRCVSGLRLTWALRRELLPSLLRFGGWVTVGNVINGALVSMERFFISAIVSVSAVGFYTAPMELVNKLWVIPVGIMTAIFPAASGLGKDGFTGVDTMYRRLFKYLLMLVGPLAGALYVFAHDLMRAWMGGDFASKSSYVLQILSIGVLINCFVHIPYNFTHSLGRPDLTAKVFMAELVPYVGLLLWAVKGWGIVGAAFAWSLRVCVETLVLACIAWRVFGLGGVVREKGFLKLLGVEIVFVGTLKILHDHFGDHRAIEIIGCSLVVLSLCWYIWFAALDEAERRGVLQVMGISR
jgi:O-antigen/teichoic acid export membrane protein